MANVLATPGDEEPGDPLAKLLKIQSEGGIIINRQCKICTSKLRAEIETMYENHVQVHKIREFMASQGLSVAQSNISHHLNEHYKKQLNLAILIDYCDNLAAMRNRRRSRIDDLEMMMDSGHMELARALSLPVGTGVSEKDRAEMIRAAKKELRDVIAMLNEMDDADAQVKTMYEKFLRVWKEKITNAKSESEREVYRNTLEQFKDLMTATN